LTNISAAPKVNVDAEFESVASNLQLHLTKVLKRAFPAGVPLSKGKGSEGCGQDHDSRYVNQYFVVYDRYLDKNISVEFRLDENYKFTVTAQKPEGYCEADVNMLTERATAAFEWHSVEGNCELSLHNLLERVAKIIGSPKGFGEKSPNQRCVNYSYKAMGKGGRVRVVNNVKDGTYLVNYRSGVTSRTYELEIAMNEESAEQLNGFYETLERDAKTNKVWHIGASQLVQQLIDAVPQHTFRHSLVMRPSYHYDVPFCDFVLEKYPDVIVLRAHHDGYQFWRDGEYVKTENVEDIIAEPLTEEIVAKYPQQLWRSGTGILYTSGTLEDTEVDGRRHVKFVPYARG